jgi:hypothetical protein
MKLLVDRCGTGSTWKIKTTKFSSKAVASNSAIFYTIENFPLYNSYNYRGNGPSMLTWICK